MIKVLRRSWQEWATHCNRKCTKHKVGMNHFKDFLLTRNSAQPPPPPGFRPPFQPQKTVAGNTRLVNSLAATFLPTSLIPNFAGTEIRNLAETEIRNFPKSKILDRKIFEKKTYLKNHFSKNLFFEWFGGMKNFLIFWKNASADFQPRRFFKNFP